MIILGLATLLLSILRLFASFLPIPSLPDPVIDSLHLLIQYTGSGISVLRCFIGDSACSTVATLLSFVVALEAFKKAWSLIWFILRKIPMLNIKE